MDAHLIMYNHFFQFKQAPFSIAPDPRFLFMSERHREALAHLLYGVGSGGGFVLLTGEIGAGKTTVCRCLLEQIPDNCRIAYIFNPKLSVIELLQSICDEFRVDCPVQDSDEVSAKRYVDALNAYLLRSHAEGNNNVLIIDEAQNLAADVLEQLRLLTNLETNERKLLQVILIGQPELRTMLARPELEQLAQRVIARYHLDALSQQETAGYIRYRMSIAGTPAVDPFPPSLMAKIFRLTRGVPRRINLLCDRALLGAYAASRTAVTPDIIDKAAKEIFGYSSLTAAFRLPQRWHLIAAGTSATLIFAAAIAWSYHQFTGAPDAGAQAAIAAQTGSFKLSHNLSENTPFLQRQSPAVNTPLQVPTSAKNYPARSFDSESASHPASMASLPAEPVTSMDRLFGSAMRNAPDAYRLLGQLWGMALKQDNACKEAQVRNIHCYRSSGGLAELKRLNRPAIMVLRDQNKVVHYALLTGLSESSAVLRIAGSARSLSISLPALEQYFHGDFITFWRAPSGYDKGISIGSKGEDVDWLAAQLAKIDGNSHFLRGQPYNAIMEQQVRAFQSAQGLPADGVAGPQTLMLLNSISNVHEPQLQAEPLVAAAMSRK